MINAADAIIVYIFQKADVIAKQQTSPWDSQKMIDLGYLRGLIAALYINGQINADRYRELTDEVHCVKITGSTFFSR